MSKNRDRVLELVNEGVLDEMTVITALLNYLSDAEVLEMAESNDFFVFLEEEEEEEEEDDYFAEPEDDFDLNRLSGYEERVNRDY